MVCRRYYHPKVARALYVEISLYVITVGKEPAHLCSIFRFIYNSKGFDMNK